MDYFCYISRNKVDQLLATVEAHEVVEIIETGTAMRSNSKSAGIAGLVSVISADLNYGRSDTFQTNRKLKVSYAQKLKKVLRSVQPNLQMFEWRLEPTARSAPAFFFYRGDFVVDTLDDDALIATLCAGGNNATLKLDCSLHYFSDEPVRGNRPFITSTNYRFFKERMPLTLESVFYLTGSTGDTFFGTPLYLKLTAVPGLLL